MIFDGADDRFMDDMTWQRGERTSTPPDRSRRWIVVGGLEDRDAALVTQARDQVLVLADMQIVGFKLDLFEMGRTLWVSGRDCEASIRRAISSLSFDALLQAATLKEGDVVLRFIRFIQFGTDAPFLFDGALAWQVTKERPSTVHVRLHEQGTELVHPAFQSRPPAKLEDTRRWYRRRWLKTVADTTLCRMPHRGPDDVLLPIIIRVLTELSPSAAST